MSTNHTKITLEPALALGRALFAAPADPPGEHLSDPEFIAYELKTLSPDECANIDAHLERCDDCLERMDLLMTAAEEWESLAGQERLRRLRGRILAQEPDFWARLADRLQEIFQDDAPVAATASMPNLALAMGGAAADRAWQGGELADGIIYWRVETLADGDMTIHVGSFALPEGTLLRISADSWHNDVRLARIAADQVGANIPLSADIRRGLNRHAPLQVHLLNVPMDETTRRE